MPSARIARSAGRTRSRRSAVCRTAEVRMVRISGRRAPGRSSRSRSRRRAAQVGLVLDREDPAGSGADVLGQAEDPGHPERAQRRAAHGGLDRVGDVLDQDLAGEGGHPVRQAVQVGGQHGVHPVEVDGARVDVAVAGRQRRR